MGHYNEVVFSGSELSAKEIWQKAMPVLEKNGIVFSPDSNNLYKDMHLTWYFEKDESQSPWGELYCNILPIGKNFHLVIAETDTFRVFYSKRTLEKFTLLSVELCTACAFKYAVYWEEALTNKIIPSNLNRASYLLREKYHSGHTPGLIIIAATEIELDKARLWAPKNSEFIIPEPGYYVYKMYGALKIRNVTY
jgi:hypothetical protein